MASKAVTTLTDDIDGSPAVRTVKFGIGAYRGEIDLSAANLARFEADMAPFVRHARPVRRVREGGDHRTAGTRRRAAEIRAFARDHGLRVSDRGTLPAAALALWDQRAGKAG